MLRRSINFKTNPKILVLNKEGVLSVTVWVCFGNSCLVQGTECHAASSFNYFIFVSEINRLYFIQVNM